LSFFKFEAFRLNSKRALAFLFNVLVKDRFAQILIVNTLSVGPKSKVLQYELEKSNLAMPYVLNWFPGMLTNHKYTYVHSQTSGLITKVKGLKKNKDSMIKNKEGVNKLVRFPSVVVFFSAYGRFGSGINEASTLGIPTIGVIDSDSTSSTLDFFIPSNDDSYLSVLYFFNLFNETMLRGFRNNILDKDEVFSLETSIDTARGFLLTNYYQTYFSKSSRMWHVLKRLKRIDAITANIKYGKIMMKAGLLIKILKFYFLKVKSIKQQTIRKKVIKGDPKLIYKGTNLTPLFKSRGMLRELVFNIKRAEQAKKRMNRNYFYPKKHILSVK